MSGAGRGRRRSSQVVRGVTPTSIKVGGLGDAQRYSGADIGAQARFTRENAAGGVNGRTFDYIGFRDDQGVGATNQQLGAQLVEQDQVFAVVPTITPDLGAVKTFTDQKVPYFGWAISSNFCGNTYGFGFTGCLFPPGGRTTSNAWGVLVKQALGAQIPNPTAVLFTENTPSGQVVLPALTAGVKSAGITVVGRDEQPAGSRGRRLRGAREQRAQRERGQAAGRGVRGRRLLQRRRAAAGASRRWVRRAVHRHDRVRPRSRRVVDGDGGDAADGRGGDAHPPTPRCNNSSPTCTRSPPTCPSTCRSSPGTCPPTSSSPRCSVPGRTSPSPGFMKQANKGFTYTVPNTVGPTKFPAAHNEPTPCGSLVRSDGSAYNVLVPYTCGKVVKVSP